MTRSILSAVVFAVVTACGAHLVAQAAPCVATTASGDVSSVRRGAVCAYRGVPYAAPPVGDLRWRPPQPRAPWAPGTLDATVDKAVCAQGAGAAATGSEDCLTLNIWTPVVAAPRRGLPVMVWLHGGDFRATSSNAAATDGQRFAEERHAIVVAINYRLGPFGFLVHSALTVEDPGYVSSGNYGLADQRAALRWVRDNIAAFGGDPDNVTLFGQSAGAISTSLHLVSPASRGLFQRAIMQSGQASARWTTAAEAEAQGERFAAALGCTDRTRVIACMRLATRDRVLGRSRLRRSSSTRPRAAFGGAGRGRRRSVQWPLFRPDPLQRPFDPSLSDRYLRFDTTVSEGSYLRDAQCNFWESFYFRSVLGVVPAAAR